MKNLNRSYGAVIFILMMLLSTVEVSGTDGYLSTAYGTRAKGLAGAGIAYAPVSVIGGNPGAKVFLGEKFSIGLAIFNPKREFTVTGEPSGMPGTFGLMSGTVESDQPAFAVPNLGGNWLIKENNSVGFSLYGNGGMNTNYPNQPAAPGMLATQGIFYGQSESTGVNLSQMFGEFTYSRKITDKHAVGVSALIGFQMFKAYGLHAFGAFGMSADPANLTNNGMDYAFGGGVKVGYLGELFDGLTLGATFQSPVFMSKLSKYAGLFAEQGSFNVPMNWTIGAAYNLNDMVVLMADYKRIHYSMVNAVANPMDPMALPPMFLVPGGNPSNPEDYVLNENYVPLGSDNGSGFGWEDVNVVKVGVEYIGVEDWMFRAGYSWCNQPIPESEVLFNILAPGVMEHHLGVGFTKVMGTAARRPELNVGFNYGFSNTVTGYNPMDFDPVEAMSGNMVPNQAIDLTMRQMDFEIGITF